MLSKLLSMTCKVLWEPWPPASPACLPASPRLKVHPSTAPGRWAAKPACCLRSPPLRMCCGRRLGRPASLASFGFLGPGEPSLPPPPGAPLLQAASVALSPLLSLPPAPLYSQPGQRRDSYCRELEMLPVCRRVTHQSRTCPWEGWPPGSRSGAGRPGIKRGLEVGGRDPPAAP